MPGYYSEVFTVAPAPNNGSRPSPWRMSICLHLQVQTYYQVTDSPKNYALTNVCVCVFVYSDLLLSRMTINDGLAITVVICMHNLAWLHHWTVGANNAAYSIEVTAQAVLLDSLLSGFEIFVPAVISKCQFFSQTRILIIHRCALKYYLQSCNSLLLFNYGSITSSVSTHELLQLHSKRL